MTEVELTQIEGALGIALPVAYRELMTTRGQELSGQDQAVLYSNADALIAANKEERQKGSGTRDAFPGWWKKFVMIGTNGGGGYYCLQLDGDPRLWMIGSDCGDTPTACADSLTEFFEGEVSRQREAAAAAPQPRSSFDRSCAILERFKITVHNRGGAAIRCQELDQPVTEATFRNHGIDTSALAQRILEVLSAVAKSPTEGVKTNFEPQPSTDMEAELPLHHIPLGDPRFWIVQVVIAAGQVQVKLRESQDPALEPGLAGIDWAKLKAAVSALFQTLFPAGVAIQVSEPTIAAEQVPGEWNYVLSYSLSEV